MFADKMVKERRKERGYKERRQTKKENMEEKDIQKSNKEKRRGRK
jgi:hypothetical protein